MNLPKIRIHTGLASFVLTMAVTVLVGWILKIPTLQAVMPGLATMKFNTALGFLGLALGLLTLRTNRPNGVSSFFTASVFILSLATVLQDLLGFDLGIDQAFVADPATPANLHPGRMSVATEVCFLIAATAAFLTNRGNARSGQNLASLLLMVCMFALAGYLYDLRDLYSIPAFSSMALHTALGFVLVALALISYDSLDGWPALFFSDLPGGLILRRIWLPGILITILVGALVESMESRAWIGRSLDSALLVVLSVFLSSLVILLAARKLDQTHAKLQNSLQEVQELIFALDRHSIVARTDTAGKITYVNDKFCQLSKYDRNQLIGQDHRIINSGFHPQEFFRNLWATIGRGSVWQGEIKNRAKDGAYYWVATTIVPFQDADGRNRQYIAIRTDITNQKAIQAELERSNADLEQFAYAASHDLQEPLRGVEGCLSLLEKKYGEELPPAARGLASQAGGDARRMRNLIDGLLEFSRLPREGKISKQFESERALEQALKNLRSVIAESGARVVHGELPALVGDEEQFVRLFQNLIGNSCKFKSPEPPFIEITARTSETEHIFSVRDNGIGIEDRFFERIFQLFQRLHTHRDYPGGGIGLALCHRIVAAHGGRLWLESQIGVGSTFYFSVPHRIVDEKGTSI